MLHLTSIGGTSMCVRLKPYSLSPAVRWEGPIRGNRIYLVGGHAMAHREGTTRISRWFTREQWGRHHAGDHQARMLWVWDDLADESQPRIVQRRDNRGIIELLLTIEVFYCASGAT